MSARNCQLQNGNGINVYPKTYAKNVYLSDGRTLEDMLTDIINGNYIAFETYQLPVATRYSLGGIMIGRGLSVDENGVLSADSSMNGTYSYAEEYGNSFNGCMELYMHKYEEITE